MVSCVRKRAYERHILFKTFAKVRVFFKTSKRFLFFLFYFLISILPVSTVNSSTAVSLLLKFVWSLMHDLLLKKLVLNYCKISFERCNECFSCQVFFTVKGALFFLVLEIKIGLSFSKTFAFPGSGRSLDADKAFWQCGYSLTAMRQDSIGSANELETQCD